MNDFKGIIGDVLVNNAPLLNWTITGFPLDDVSAIEDLVAETVGNDIQEHSGRLVDFSSDILNGGPKIFHATFDIDSPAIHDTYINPTGWGKVCFTGCSFAFGSKHVMTSLFSSILGNNFHQWIQFGAILAAGWTANYTVPAERAAAPTRKFTHFDWITKSAGEWPNSVQWFEHFWRQIICGGDDAHLFVCLKQIETKVFFFVDQGNVLFERNKNAYLLCKFVFCLVAKGFSVVKHLVDCLFSCWLRPHLATFSIGFATFAP